MKLNIFAIGVSAIIKFIIGLSIVVACVIVGLSGYVNFVYGKSVSSALAWMSVSMSALEIALPLLGIFAAARHRKLAHWWAAALMVFSVFTALSFMSSARYKGEDSVKGYASELEANRRDLANARTAYNLSVTSALKAASACTSEILKGGKGYITKACGTSEKASIEKEKALAEVKRLEAKVTGSKTMVISPADKIFDDLARITTLGTAQTWKFGNLLFFGVLTAASAFVIMLVISNVWSLNFATAKPKQKATTKGDTKDQPGKDTGPSLKVVSSEKKP